MLEVGSRATNSRTQTEFEVLEMAPEGFVLRYSMPKDCGLQDFAEHFHVGWHEEFTIIEGDVIYKLDGKEHRATAGDVVPFPERLKHLHPRNAGATPAILEHRATLDVPSIKAVKDTLGFFFTMFDWEAEGKIALDRIGLPRHPMKFFAAGRMLGAHGGYDARLPKAVADFGNATMGRLAEAMGYSVVDPKWR